jgi:hypothetical protein
MAKRKPVTFVDRLEKAAGDVADAVSVAATGSQVGVLELAAEDELGVRPVKARKKKPVVRKKVAPKKAAKKTAGKRLQQKSRR